MTEDSEEQQTPIEVEFHRLMDLAREKGLNEFFAQNPTAEQIADLVACSMDIGLETLASATALDALKRGIIKNVRAQPGIIYRSTIAESFENGDQAQILLMAGWSKGSQEGHA